MKFALMLLLALPVAAVATSAANQTPKAASPEELVCSQLKELADQDCVSLMCDQNIADGVFKDVDECTSSEDYDEAAQAACEDTLSDRVTEYNAKNPGAKVTCEE